MVDSGAVPRTFFGDKAAVEAAAAAAVEAAAAAAAAAAVADVAPAAPTRLARCCAVRVSAPRLALGCAYRHWRL